MRYMRIGARRWTPMALMVLVLAAPIETASAAGFAVLITPPRFELRAQPGEVLRQVIEVTNAADSPARLSVATSEWQLNEDGSVVFTNPLAEDSCRPWSALETRELELGPNGRRRFRFEVAVPADAVERECRFAIMFEGDPEPMGPLELPVAGRIAVIIYLAIGSARAQLELREVSVREFEGQRVPALTVTNSGNAHTRLAGFVSGRDERGRSLVMVPESAPVLPGQTRTILLHPQLPEGEAAVDISFPVRLSGRLDWSGQRLELDQVFSEE
jgi:fimbrial chaperone protein